MVKKISSADWMTIGQVSERTGLATSAIRYYEDERLIFPTRDRAGNRRFRRADIRRLSFIMIAQRLGFPLSRIRQELSALPDARTPSARDWERMSARFGAELDERIATLSALRDKLTGCIGCGCLSMKNCALFNPDDGAASLGAGPRYLMGDAAEDIGH